MSYDIKKLAAKLKEKGLDVAEEGAKVAVESVLEWVKEEAVASENKVDDILVAIIPVVKPHIMEQIDKIDGAEG